MTELEDAIKKSGVDPKLFQEHLNPKEEARIRTGRFYFEALERSKPPYDYERIEPKDEEAFYRIADSRDDIVGHCLRENDAKTMVMWLNKIYKKPVPTEEQEYFEIVDNDGKPYEGIERQLVDYNKTYSFNFFGQDAHRRGVNLLFFKNNEPTRLGGFEVEGDGLWRSSTLQGYDVTVKLIQRNPVTD